MSLRSLAMRSELLTLSGISHLTEHDDYLVQFTPTEPDFWMGNQLIMSDAKLSAPETFVIFETHFPDASHRSVVWDIPNLDPLKVREVGDLGCMLDGFDTMTLQGSLRDAVMPDGMSVRALDAIDDWTKAEALQAEVGLEEGRDPKSYGPYLARRNAGRREQITKGIGQWFGAFEGDRIVAQLGMFHDDSIARYQSVETRATHRRRGICSALLRHAALWALGRAPNADVVIVAEADTDAGRLYRKMGFAHAETIYGIVRDGY
jgi:GNAT superfamily N-acetyltransferase